MSGADTLILRPVRPGDAGALAALYAAADAPCHCRFWHFEGDKNEWLERCFVRPEENRAEMVAAVEAEREDALGIVATLGDAGAIVGWCKIAPSAAVPKAYEQRYYRGLGCFDGDRASTYLVGCVLVHPAHRRGGLAAQLIRAATTLAAERGASALEGFPRRVSAEVSDGELWMGPAGCFERAGFSPVGGEDPYPVLRKRLVPADALVRPTAERSSSGEGGGTDR